MTTWEGTRFRNSFLMAELGVLLIHVEKVQQFQSKSLYSETELVAPTGLYSTDDVSVPDNCAVPFN